MERRSFFQNASQPCAGVDILYLYLLPGQDIILELLVEGRYEVV